MSVLVYVGTNLGNSLWNMIQDYDQVYAFEADPEIFEQLNRRFRQFEWVTLVNAACSDTVGEVDLYVTPNRVSTSLSDASKMEKNMGCPPILKKVKVQSINLCDYLQENGVDEIDFYQSDIQGSDLTVLKTLKSKYIDTKKIKKMFIETHGNGIEIYDGLYNQFDGFKKVLSENYKFTYASLGSQGGKVVNEENIPEGEKEWDSFWEVKE
tara:strand:+ start:3125 stop:3754 length:630 start_codon:yes stop_codon:yes gene_type:complete